MNINKIKKALSRGDIDNFRLLMEESKELNNNEIDFLIYLLLTTEDFRVKNEIAHKFCDLKLNKTVKYLLAEIIKSPDESGTLIYSLLDLKYEPYFLILIPLTKSNSFETLNMVWFLIKKAIKGKSKISEEEKLIALNMLKQYKKVLPTKGDDSLKEKRKCINTVIWLIKSSLTT